VGDAGRRAWRRQEGWEPDWDIILSIWASWSAVGGWGGGRGGGMGAGRE
jgi:hypothetical protein